MTNPTYPGHKPHVMKVYAGVMSENVITGRIMYIWNSDNNEFTAFAINLKKK